MIRMLALSLLGACGSLDNDPLRTGIVRGQLTGTDAKSVVSVIDHEELITHPDAEGRFELTGVPLGNVELLVIINARESRRIPLSVGAASVSELGAVAPEASHEFEVYVRAPSGQKVTGGTVSILGTPLVEPISMIEDEAEFFLPPACYQALVSVPGLGTKTIEGCMAPTFEKFVTFDPPDGTPGREGCSVTGCTGVLVCQADGSCR